MQGGSYKSLSNEKTPDQLATVFAGVDKEATDAARSKMIPSSFISKYSSF